MNPVRIVLTSAVIALSGCAVYPTDYYAPYPYYEGYRAPGYYDYGYGYGYGGPSVFFGSTYYDRWGGHRYWKDHRGNRDWDKHRHWNNDWHADRDVGNDRRWDSGSPSAGVGKGYWGSSAPGAGGGKGYWGGTSPGVSTGKGYRR